MYELLTQYQHININSKKNDSVLLIDLFHKKSKKICNKLD